MRNQAWHSFSNTLIESIRIQLNTSECYCSSRAACTFSKWNIKTVFQTHVWNDNELLIVSIIFFKICLINLHEKKKQDQGNKSRKSKSLDNRGSTVIWWGLLRAARRWPKRNGSFLLWVIGGIYSAQGDLGVWGDRGSRPSTSHTLQTQLPCLFLTSSPKPFFDCKILILHKFLLISPTTTFLELPPPTFTSPTSRTLLPSILLAPVIQMLDSAIHRINHLPVDRNWSSG